MAVVGTGLTKLGAAARQVLRVLQTHSISARHVRNVGDLTGSFASKTTSNSGRNAALHSPGASLRAE
jgi:hypothetical protein